MPITKDTYEILSEYRINPVKGKQNVANLCSIIHQALKEHMGWDDEKSKLWMRIENPMFGSIAPMKLIMWNRSHKVVQMILVSIEESTPANVWPWGETREQSVVPSQSGK